MTDDSPTVIHRLILSPTGTQPFACQVSSSHTQCYTGLRVVLSAEITFLPH